ncbi:MAG TPA: two-component regulator propeller domain-containing protein [Chitinophagaceae bacterium]|nr:two-component regulator propeller domain-containing protein [Chitinophagaceae bacterium]
MKKRLTILLSGFFYLLQLQAQHQPSFINKTEADGLSDNRITCFYKDKKGYVWIGTESGLNRYNGNSFKIYRPLSAQHHDLSDAYITSIAQDSKGHVWVSTRKGLNRIDFFTDTTEFIHAAAGENINLPFENVWDVFPENDTSVWIAIDTKYFLRYDPVKKQLYSFDFRQYLTDNKIEYTPRYHSVFKIAQRSAEELWLATTEGIFSFNKRTGTFTLVYGVPLDRISFFHYESESGKLYCADERNILYIYEEKMHRMLKTDLGANSNRNKPLLPYFAGQHGLFIPAPEGLAWINENNQVAAFIPGNLTKENALLPGKITTTFKDNKGITWIGTEKGMSRFVPSLNANLHISFPQNLQYDVAYSLKNFIYNKEREEWLVASYSDNTIWKVNNSTGQVDILKRPSSFNNDTCYAFYSRHPDTVFLLCNNVLLTYHYPTHSWQKQHFPSPWDQGTLTSMTIDPQGNYWLGTRRKGLFVFDPVLKTIWSPPISQLDMSIIHSLQYDPYNNCIWIGSFSNGLYSFSLKERTFRNIPRNDSIAGAFHSSLINDIAIGRHGTIWSATLAGGLVKYTPGQKTGTGIINYETRNGLPDNNIFSIAIDKNDQPWFTTSKGIGWMNSTGERTLFLNKESGLPYSKFQQSIACLPGDLVATAVDNSLFSFFAPALLQQEDNNLVLDQIRLNDTNAISNDDHSFNHKQNTFGFDYSLLDFTAPGAIEYFCKLEGFDDDWIMNGNLATIRYAGLTPGKYTFRVKAKKTDGTFNEREVSWSFSITPPFWETWWFKILVLTLIAFTGWWLYQRRVKKIRTDERVRNDYEKRIAETEMQALRAQMNPHFMFNSLNSINNFILKNDPDNASGYLTKFSRLMRLILDNSRSEWVVLENELKALALYIELEAVRFDSAFSYSLEITKDIDAETVMVPPLIIQPYVENAIWHGLLHRKDPEGRIDIRLWKNNGTLYIEVEDNGVGRDEAKRLKSKTATRHKSHGMKITAERMDIVNKVYNVEAGVTITDLGTGTNNTGTRVLITLKYRTYDSHYSG